jgi:hypothetical protein
MRSRIAFAAAIAAATTTLGLAAVAPASVTTAQAACGTFVGPTWSYVNPLVNPPNQSGTTWKVTARGVKCSFATMWAKKLVKTPFKGEARTKFKVVPKAWSCIAGGGLTGGGKGTPGTCSQGTQGKKLFSWGPAVPTTPLPPPPPAP